MTDMKIEKVKLRPNGTRLTRVRVAKDPGGPSLAKQSFASECDINKILKQYKKNGTITHVQDNQPQYGNFIGYEDYHSSMNKILDAQEAFASIPSAIRSRFYNDPAQFLEFAQNPDNHDEMISLGLLPPDPPPRDRQGPPLDDHPGNPPDKPPGKPDLPGKPSTEASESP